VSGCIGSQTLVSIYVAVFFRVVVISASLRTGRALVEGGGRNAEFASVVGHAQAAGCLVFQGYGVPLWQMIATSGRWERSMSCIPPRSQAAPGIPRAAIEGTGCLRSNESDRDGPFPVWRRLWLTRPGATEGGVESKYSYRVAEQ
jgi:hypothetical protein